jgi:hypothetical protein
MISLSSMVLNALGGFTIDSCISNENHLSVMGGRNWCDNTNDERKIKTTPLRHTIKAQ